MTEKWPKPWHMGTHLRVLSESYPMNTNMTGFKWFSKIFASLCFGQMSPYYWSMDAIFIYREFIINTIGQSDFAGAGYFFIKKRKSNVKPFLMQGFNFTDRGEKKRVESYLIFINLKFIINPIGQSNFAGAGFFFFLIKKDSLTLHHF